MTPIGTELPAYKRQRELRRAREDRGGWHFKRAGDLEDVRERDVALAALDVAVVASVQPALERELFLGYALSFRSSRTAAPKAAWDGESEDIAREVCLATHYKSTCCTSQSVAPSAESASSDKQ